MKKKIILILPLLLLLVGCVKLDSKDKDYKIVLDNTLSKMSTIQNKASTGYKYYLPQGVNLIQDKDYNQIFTFSDIKMYMYVDIISYYYKNTVNYNDTNYNYYYLPLNYHDKSGYLLINKENDKYFVKIVYNYAKIELYTNYDNLTKAIAFSSIMLNSINYNDTIIENIIDNNINNYSDISYKLDKPEDSKSNFSQYLEEYTQEENNNIELPDE